MQDILYPQYHYHYHYHYYFFYYYHYLYDDNCYYDILRLFLCKLLKLFVRMVS